MLRDYQRECVEAVCETWRGGPEQKSAMVVMATGTGKTVVLSEIARRHIADARSGVMVLAHRHELIQQLRATVARVLGRRVEVEMGVNYASFQSDVPVVAGSVQSLNGKRLRKFDPKDFGLVVVDEAHHSVAESYLNVLDWFRQNPACRILGVTATPDRADEEALGRVFRTAPYIYDIVDATNDGWLVPLRVESVIVEGLDFSTVKRTAGDFNSKDLARVMANAMIKVSEEGEETHSLAQPILDKARGRQTLVFAINVAQGQLLAEVLCRHSPNSAEFVCGETVPETRAAIFDRFRNKETQILVNVGIATEGTDLPGVEVVAMARPTQSRSLCCQMIGRGTRPLPGTVDGEGLDTPEARKAAIAASAKPHALIIDFTGNSSKHKLITPLDVLGGALPDAVRQIAEEMIAEGGEKDLSEVMGEAAEELKRREEIALEEKLKREAQEAERLEREAKERAERAHIKAGSVYSTRTRDMFSSVGVPMPVEKPGDKTRGRSLSSKMVSWMKDQGVWDEKMTDAQKGAMSADMVRRAKGGYISLKQARILKRWNYSDAQVRDMPKAIGGEIMSGLVAEGWKKLPGNVPIKPEGGN